MITPFEFIKTSSPELILTFVYICLCLLGKKMVRFYIFYFFYEYFMLAEHGLGGWTFVLRKNGWLEISVLRTYLLQSMKFCFIFVIIVWIISDIEWSIIWFEFCYEFDGHMRLLWKFIILVCETGTSCQFEDGFEFFLLHVTFWLCKINSRIHLQNNTAYDRYYIHNNNICFFHCLRLTFAILTLVFSWNRKFEIFFGFWLVKS